MKKKRGRYYRTRMKVGYERRNNQDCEYVRAKRRPKNLPNPWDDVRSCYQKTWKVLRKQQYRPGGRGQRYELMVKVHRLWRIEYEFREYCQEHDIPHTVERIFEREVIQVPVYRREIVYRWVWNGKRHCLAPFIQDVETGEYRDKVVKNWVGEKLIWWSHKQIDMVWALCSAMSLVSDRQILPDELFREKPLDNHPAPCYNEGVNSNKSC